MAAAPDQLLPARLATRWRRLRARHTWLDWDLFAGAVVGTGVTALALNEPAIREAAPATLFVILGVSAGLLGFVLGALSLFVALLSEDYLTVLSKAPGGLSRAWSPYKVVAVSATFTAVLSLIVVASWEAMISTIQAGAFGLATGGLVWSLIGTSQLVGITKFHGQMRLNMLQHVRHAQALLRDRKADHRSA